MSLEVQVLGSLTEVDATDWDALVDRDDPFCEHRFLLALESSGSAVAATGWAPRHLVATDGSALVAAWPMWLKSHSYGEYIFDWAFAQGARRAGLAYYPKLASQVPFTPATGRRILSRDLDRHLPALWEAARALADREHASSVHVLFCTADEQAALARVGLTPRLTHQLHWTNTGYGSFEDLLAAFRQPARRQVRREREQARASGLTLAVRRGPDLTAADWAVLRACYLRTAERYGAIPYLSERFFDALSGPLAERVVAALAYDGEVPVACAFGFQKGRHLYGRYWGALVDVPALHFELCYYQLLEFAIGEGLTRFEAGAQGEHKLKRGLLPSATYSAHWIRHPGLSDAVGDYVVRETAHVQAEMAELLSHSPFRRPAL